MTSSCLATSSNQPDFAHFSINTSGGSATSGTIIVGGGTHRPQPIHTGAYVTDYFTSHPHHLPTAAAIEFDLDNVAGGSSGHETQR